MVEQFAPAEAGHTIIRVDGRDIISSTAVRALAHLALAAPTVPGIMVQYTGKKTPGGAGTHTGHTGHTGARGHTDHTDEPHNQPPKPKRTQTRTKTARITRTNLTTIHPNPTTQTRTKTATDSTAARTAASPESTAPRGRLRRGRPRRTRPCLHPLPERLPAPARRRSAK